MSSRTVPGRPQSGRASRGAILVETLVAVLILAAMLSVLFEAVSTNAAALRTSASRQEAMLIAQSRLSEVGVLDVAVPGTARGEAAGLSWEVDITAFGGKREDSSNLNLVTVTVREPDGRRVLARLRSLRFGARPR